MSALRRDTFRISRLRLCGESVPVPTAACSVGPDCMQFGPNVFYYGSCTAALAAALVACIPERVKGVPQAILPAYSSPALLNAVMLAGIKPRFVDFQPDSPFLDPDDLKRSLSDATVAIVSVRLMGLPANAGEIKRSLRGRLVPIIEDAAHCYPGSLASQGEADAVTYSFAWGKPVSAGGGGALVVSDANHIDRKKLPLTGKVVPSLFTAVLASLEVAARNFLRRPVPYGMVTRLLGIASENLRYRSPSLINGIRSDHFGRLLAQSDKGRAAQLKLQSTFGLALAALPNSVLDLPASLGADGVRLWRYPILLATSSLRDRCFDALWRAGLGASKLYQSLLTSQEIDGASNSTWPNASSFATRVLTLPVHSDVNENDALEIVAIIGKQMAA